MRSKEKYPIEFHIATLLLKKIAIILRVFLNKSLIKCRVPRLIHHLYLGELVNLFNMPLLLSTQRSVNWRCILQKAAYLVPNFN